MVDPITVIAIVSGISALFVSIFTHIKHSKCFCVDIETTAERGRKSPFPAEGSRMSPLNPFPVDVEVFETFERGRISPLNPPSVEIDSFNYFRRGS